MLMAKPEHKASGDPLPTRDPVAQRILLVLEACAAEKGPLTMTELVEATGLAKTTVHRMCWKLVDLGLLEHASDGFAIGTKLFALAAANPVINEIRVAAMPYLLELQPLTGAADLAILVGGKALIVDTLFTRELGGSGMVGAGLPLHCTAVGKALAAGVDHERREELLGPGLLPSATTQSIVHPVLIRRHLERVAQEGVAFSHEEFEVGRAGVAATFTSRDGTIGAIGCVGAWNNLGIRRSSARVAVAAAGLQRALAAH